MEFMPLSFRRFGPSDKHSHSVVLSLYPSPARFYSSPMRSLSSDLKHLDTLAFHRRAHCGPLLEKFHSLAQTISVLPTAVAEQIWNLYDWLLVPLSLWPVDFEGLAVHVLATVETSSSTLAQPLSETLSETPAAAPVRRSASDDGGSILHSALRLLHLMDAPPSPDTQSVVAAFEHDIESGRYEKMLKQAAKFDEQEKALLQNQQLAAEWAELKRLFDIKQFQNSRGVIRRRMSQERNLREPGWPFDWSDPRRRFHFFFDAFCYRWKLYGMEHDRPLLLKISVNPTPQGTMILIPRHWSLDPRRDLDWPLITRLHRSRGAKRQGPKLSSGRIQKLQEAKKVRSLWQSGSRNGLKGERLHEFICQAMKHDIRSDPSWWKRLLGTQT